MKHHGRVSINAPPHSEACFCFELELMWGARTHNRNLPWQDSNQFLMIGRPALYHGAFPPEELKWDGVWGWHQPQSMYQYLGMIDCDTYLLQAVDNGELEFVPEYYSKTWKHFLSRTADNPWCISRQLWWGHPIPAYKVLEKLSDGRYKVWLLYLVAYQYFYSFSLIPWSLLLHWSRCLHTENWHKI